MALSMANVGEIKTIKALKAKDEVKRHLMNLGFIVGEKVEVISDNPSGLILLVKNTKVALNKAMANKILVQ
ncbi:MAG: ferrous iron transport protein A [Clostridiales bacterium]|nr:ferrous iron transport protein A [Clostridiales bacterium]